MKKKLLIPIIVWSVVIAVAFGLSRWASLNFWVMLAIVAGGVLINGFVVTLEDDLPGGFNNPDGTQPPGYTRITAKIVRGLFVVFVLLCIVVLGLWAWG